MKSAVCVALLALSVSVSAQTESVAPTNVPLRPVVKMDPAQPEIPAFEVSAAWNEESKGQIQVPLENTSDKSLKLLGVQCTPGLFVVDYPEKIHAKSKDDITVIYEAAEDTDTGDEILRVKTDQGIKTLKVRITRSAGVTLDRKEVHWDIGEASEPKSITINLGSTGITPTSVSVSGGGHTAELVKVDAVTYRVKLRPASTAKPTHFAAKIKFSQRVPGLAPIITGSVGE